MVVSSATSRRRPETAAALTNCGRLPMTVVMRMLARSGEWGPPGSRLRTGPPGIIPCVMARKLLHGAREAADGVAGAARHLAWYLSYCLDGSATRSVDRVDASGAAAARGRVD